MKRTLALALFTLAISVFAETGMGRHKKIYAVPAPGECYLDSVDARNTTSKENV